MAAREKQGEDALTCGKMSERGTPVGWIGCPEQLVKQAAVLLLSQAWEEIVVGLALVSGRCVVEVLKTGVIMPKTRYSLVCTAYQEQADQVLGPFELPTLVEADTVLSAWQRVRTLVDCEELSAQEIGTRYRRQVTQCAKAQFEQEVPLAGSQEDWYTPLYARLYPLIATRYYCPKGKDQAWFGAVVRGLTWPPSSAMKTAACTCCDEGQHLCGVYQVGDGVNPVEAEVGLRLDEEGVELLECVQEPEKPSPAKELDVCSDAQVKQSPVRKSGSSRAQGQTPLTLRPSSVGKESRSARNLKEVARQRSAFTEDDWDAYESAVVLAASKQIQQEREASASKSSDGGRMSIIYLDDPLKERLEQVRQCEGTSTIDGTLAVLVDGYEWLHRGGGLLPLGSSERTQAEGSPDENPPRPYAIRGVTEDRLVAIDQAKAAKGLEKVIEQVLDTYEWLMQGGLSKGLCEGREGMAPDPEGVWLHVEPQIKDCLQEIQEEEGGGLNDTLAMLIWTYGWLWRSGMLDQITSLASTALSCMLLDEEEQEMIEDAMQGEVAAARFRVLQDLYLEYARGHRHRGRDDSP